MRVEANMIIKADATEQEVYWPTARLVEESERRGLLRFVNGQTIVPLFVPDETGPGGHIPNPLRPTLPAGNVDLDYAIPSMIPKVGPDGESVLVMNPDLEHLLEACLLVLANTADWCSGSRHQHDDRSPEERAASMFEMLLPDGENGSVAS